MRTGSIFLAANVLAGVCHYLFQVAASRELSALDFSALNAWFSSLALFFVIGGVLQYAACFFPTAPAKLRPAILFINIFCLLLLWLWPHGPGGQTLARALMVLSGTSLFGWLMGQIQIRLMFYTMSVANLVVGATKLALVATPILNGTATERYTFAIFACYLPALWVISFMLWRRAEQPPRADVEPSLSLWAAPVILSVAGAVIPQMDIVLMSRIQEASVFADFARASLFYKGIYFLFFILAQWLLPQQIRESPRATVRIALGLALAAVVGSGLVALISPLVISLILKWDQPLGLMLIFLSCLNMSLLTWMFLLIQGICASGRVRPAAVALVGLAVEAGLQLLLGLNSYGYLALAIACQAALVTVLVQVYPALRPRSS